jgi:hypothetical protein
VPLNLCKAMIAIIAGKKNRAIGAVFLFGTS